MKTKLIGTIGALVLFALGTQAGATTVLPDISAGESFFGSLSFSTPGVDVAETWEFTLTEDLLTAVTIDSNDLVPFFSIEGFTATSVLPFTYDAVDNKYTFIGNLPAGTYTFDISGVTAGSLGGQYAVSVGGVAVPAPAAFWLFSGALLLLRRRTAK